MDKIDAKTIYAQSSDIKSRTYLGYRKDMKRKAIIELELLDWLSNIARKEFNDSSLDVKKAGGDAFIWFLRKGGITRGADYNVIGKKKFEIELQYGDDIKPESIFDFKISKVAKKDRKTKKRVPLSDLVFLYLFKEKPQSYCFLDTKWLFKNGIEGTAPAWGNREVYKVTGSKLLPFVKESKELERIWQLVKIKFAFLEFQHELIDITKDKLSYLLQEVVDEKKIIEILPRDLDSFFKICFILDNLNKIPRNVNLWLIYILSFLSQKNTSEDLSKVVYCIDFLYSKTELNENEVRTLVEKIKFCFKILNNFERKDGLFKSSPNLSPIDEARYSLFAINLLEDLNQDLIFYYKVKNLMPITEIYQNLHYIDKTYSLIKKTEG